jgi:hypothetical protein
MEKIINGENYQWRKLSIEKIIDGKNYRWKKSSGIS